jgi:glycerol kinase
MLQNIGERPILSSHRLLTTVAWRIGATTEYALEGSVFVGGAAVQWLRDGLGIIKSSADIEALANSVADNGGVYFVPAFAGLGAPYWDQDARGTIVGLTRGSERGHIARAAIESICFQTADVLEAMQADGGTALTALCVDGGAAVNDSMLQFQADIIGIPVIRPAIGESTALGAAFLAGLSVGVWESKATLRRFWREDKRFEPSMSAAMVDELKAGWRDAVAKTLH